MNGTKANAADSVSFENQLALGQMENIANGGLASDPVSLGHKYGLPDLPLPSNSNLKHRYDPVVSQVTNLLMKDGKLSVAQRVGSSVSLTFILRCLASQVPLNLSILIHLCEYRTCPSF
jgi:small subunit ribosomal protein S7